MIEFFLTTFRLLRGMTIAWRRAPDFRSLTFLVFVTLLGGTVFYSLEEGWSVVDAFYFSVTTLTTVGLGDLSHPRRRWVSSSRLSTSSPG